MKNLRTKYTVFFVLLSLFILGGCKNEWDERTDLTDESLKYTLFEKIQQNTDLSEFAGLLVKTGYDKLLGSSLNYTVWAPTNEALVQVDKAILQDTAALRQFVGNHISIQSYLSSSKLLPLRIQLLNGKYETFTANTFENAHLAGSDQYARNGILHILNQAVLVKQNIWEFIQTADLATAQRQYLLSLETDSTTGLLGKVANLKDEKQQFTFFLLEDEAYQNEKNKLLSFYATSTTDSTQNLAAWSLVSDLAVKGAYPIDSLPDTLVSITNVKIPIHKSAIKRTIQLSNGVLYILNNLSIPTVNKFTPIIIQGESPYALSRNDKNLYIYYRLKQDPQGNSFRDIMAYGHGTSQFYIQYKRSAIPSGTYKVFWRAVAGNQDNQTIEFQQRIAFKTWNATNLNYTTVKLNDYTDVEIGTYTVTAYGPLDVFLVAAASATTGQNTLSLDYIKLVPVLNTN